MPKLPWFAALAALPLAAAADDVLPARVQAVLAHRAIPPDTVSIHIENLATGEVPLSWLPDRARSPASIMKVITTLVALDVLGPGYRWKTELYLLGDVNDGTLDGDLLLKGYGDPYLVTERMWQLQRQLRAAGVRDITGQLALDDSWFDVGDYDPAAFDREPLRAYNVAPNALLANYKVASFTFRPSGDGRGVTVAMEPPLANLAIDNRLELAPGGCHGYQRGITVTANDDGDRVTFSGRFPAGCKAYRMDRSVLGHNAYTAGLFRALWTESGGRIGPGYRRATAPAGQDPDLVFDSLPLAEIVRKINKHSNNVMARQLLYTMAAETAGPPGTEAGGRAVVERWLGERGLEFDELELDNGAGLSREARVSARYMVRLLRYGFESRHMPDFVSSLPLSGTDGTLSRRLQRGGLAGIAHMKTGSLDHVSSLAGFVLGRRGERYAVVVIVNHLNVHRGTGDEVQDAVLRWLREQ